MTATQTLVAMEEPAWTGRRPSRAFAFRAILDCTVRKVCLF